MDRRISYYRFPRACKRRVLPFSTVKDGGTVTFPERYAVTERRAFSNRKAKFDLVGGGRVDNFTRFFGRRFDERLREKNGKPGPT